MPVLQDDLANAIRSIMRESDFDTYLPDDRVDVGLSWEDVGDLGAFGRALIVPLEAAIVDSRAFEASYQTEFRFLVIYQVSSLADLFALVTGFQDVMRRKFGDGGRTLEAALTDSTATWLGKSLRVALDTPVIRSGGEPQGASLNPDGVEVRFALAVRAWQLAV